MSGLDSVFLMSLQDKSSLSLFVDEVTQLISHTHVSTPVSTQATPKMVGRKKAKSFQNTSLLLGQFVWTMRMNFLL